MFSVLGGLCGLVSFVCWIILLIAAFKDEVWKGVVGLFCGLYLLYYGIVEFQHEQKMPIVLGFFFGNVLSGVFFAIARQH